MIDNTHIPFPPDEVNQTIPARFEKIVNKTPDSLAVSHNELHLSYDQLNRRANCLAHALNHHLGEQPELVILLLDEPVNHTIAQLGILKAGMTCVPMDAAFPAARQAQMLKDSSARMIVTESRHHADAVSLMQRQGQVLALDRLSNFSSDNLGVSREPSSLAYVLFTSGSTGRPKGVMQTHKNLLHVAMLYQRDLGVGCTDRFSTPTSPAYTGTIWAMLGSLTNGAAFLFTSFDSPHTFLESLNRRCVTVVQLIPTLFRQFLLAFHDLLEIPSLRLVYTGGEALHQEDVKKFVRIFPNACSLLYNFGSTEAGMITHFPVNPQNLRSNDPVIPVGFPVEDTEVMLVDENGKRMIPPEEGEICVSSAFLSPGYWRDDELTHARFKRGGKYDRIYFTGDFGRITPDGHILHLGRKDNQVKVRGYRVNLEEVEQAFRGIEGIAAAAVLVREDSKGKIQIVAYIERNGSRDLSVRELRNRLETLLPSYMIPSLLFYIDHLPVASNGKLNRNLLSTLNCSRPELDSPLTLPETDTEKFLCGILSELLSIEPVGSKDNLFELGADSINIFQLIGRVQTALHIDINPAIVFGAPVVEDLARKLNELSQNDQ